MSFEKESRPAGCSRRGRTLSHAQRGTAGAEPRHSPARTLVALPAPRPAHVSEVHQLNHRSNTCHRTPFQKRSVNEKQRESFVLGVCSLGTRKSSTTMYKTEGRAGRTAVCAATPSSFTAVKTALRTRQEFTNASEKVFIDSALTNAA